MPTNDAELDAVLESLHAAYWLGFYEGRLLREEPPRPPLPSIEADMSEYERARGRYEGYQKANIWRMYER